MTEPMLPEELKSLETELRRTSVELPSAGVEEAAWNELRVAGGKRGGKPGSAIMLLTALAAAALAAVLYMNLHKGDSGIKLSHYVADDEGEDQRAVMEMPAMPVGGRLFASTCWVGERYFVIWGGENVESGNERFTDGACYDCVTNRWSVLEKASLEWRIHPEIVALGDDAVMIWGGQALGQQKETNEERYLVDGVIYKIPSGEMTVVKDAPIEGRMSPAVSYGSGKVLIACGIWTQHGYYERPVQTGGVSDYKHYNDGAVYDIKTREWKTTEFPLAGRDHPVVAQVKGGCVVWGGMVEIEDPVWGNDERRLFNDGALFSFDTLEWKKLPDCPVENLQHAYYFGTRKVFNDRLVVIKGRSGVLAVFDSVAFRWLQAQSLEEGNKAITGWTDNGLYALYGDGNLQLWDVKNREWQDCEKSPIPFGADVYVTTDYCNGKLAQWGGHDATQKPYRYSNRGAMYDFHTDTWHEMAEFPLQRDHRVSPATVFNGRHFVVAGGRDLTPEKNQGKGSFVYFSDAAVYDARHHTWDKLEHKVSAYEITAPGKPGTVLLNPITGDGLWFSNGE